MATEEQGVKGYYADARYQQAAALLKQSKYEEAIAFFGKLLKNWYVKLCPGIGSGIRGRESPHICVYVCVAQRGQVRRPCAGNSACLLRIRKCDLRQG